MPKRKTKRRTPRRRTYENTYDNQNEGFSLFGLTIALAVIAAGFAYAYGYFPESFNLANLELPKMNLPEVPHSSELPQIN